LATLRRVMFMGGFSNQALRHSVKRLSSFAAAMLVIAVLRPGPALGLIGDCSQPIRNAGNPVAADCLFILNVAVGAQICDPECICAPTGSLPVTATDALLCLQAAVGQFPQLSCPCDITTTTSTFGVSTTLPMTTTADDDDNPSRYSADLGHVALGRVNLGQPVKFHGELPCK